MISDKQAEAANDFIRDNADNHAKAKSNRVYLSEFRKSQKAILMKEVDGPEHVRAAHAYSHPDYIKNLEGLKAAVYEEERLRWKMVAAEAKIDMWRTHQANNRRGI